MQVGGVFGALTTTTDFFARNETDVSCQSKRLAAGRRLTDVANMARR